MQGGSRHLGVGRRALLRRAAGARAAAAPGRSGRAALLAAPSWRGRCRRAVGCAAMAARRTIGSPARAHPHPARRAGGRSCGAPAGPVLFGRGELAGRRRRALRPRHGPAGARPAPAARRSPRHRAARPAGRHRRALRPRHGPAGARPAPSTRRSPRHRAARPAGRHRRARPARGRPPTAAASGTGRRAILAGSPAVGIWRRRVGRRRAAGPGEMGTGWRWPPASPTRRLS